MINLQIQRNPYQDPNGLFGAGIELEKPILKSHRPADGPEESKENCLRKSWRHQHFPNSLLHNVPWDFPGGLKIKNSPANSGDMRSMPGRETKISHAAGQLSPCSTAGEATAMGTVHHDERAAPLTRDSPGSNQDPARPQISQSEGEAKKLS